MRKIRSLFLLLVMLCAFSLQLQAKVIHLLPKPQEVNLTTGGAPFVLGRPVSVNASTECASLTRFLTQYGCTVEDGAAATVNVTIGAVDGAHNFELAGYPDEAYTLEITANEINIVAVTETGVIRAAQTLAQLAQGYDGTAELEALTLKDWPAFKVRGYMHDVGRSFMSVEQIKKQIDLLAKFKVNTFHWHFTENQAWRLEIKKYPQLTEAEHMTRFPGSFYTQEQCKDVQQYAWERGVMIIPEVDMPGHSEAFTRAMGYNMQTEQGVAALKDIIKEVCELFDKSTYIHIGGDEVTITWENFLETMIDEVKKYGKEAMVWNPIKDVTVSNLDAAMTQMWSTSGTKIAGKANLDCRYNYTNHFDVFADLVGIYKSNIYSQAQGTAEVPGFLSCPWNDRKTETEADIIRQNNFYANVIASTERAWKGGGKQYIETGGTMLPNSGDEFNEFADWERRFLFHKDNTFDAEQRALIPYVKQTNVRWKITDGFPNGGDASMEFPPETELKDTYTYNGTNYNVGVATGAGIYLSHTWPTVIPTYFGKNAALNQTAYAWTWVYSPVEQTAGALIEFQNYGRSERDKAPDAGQWDRKGSRLWLNGTEILPPTWENSGVNIGNDWEKPLKNENFTARTPIQVQLNEGWNKVLIKLPYVSAGNVRLNKWMFTFVLTDPTGSNALDNVTYSPSKSIDENAERVANKITEVRRSVNDRIGEKIGYYPASVAETILAKLSEIEATLSTTMSAEDRDAQIAAIDAAKTNFDTSLSTATPNMPTPSTDGNITYYSIKDKRGGKYAISGGANNGVTGSTSASGNYLWKFVERTATTFDIVNTGDNTYLNPASAANNAQLKTSATQPTDAWSINLAGDGYVTITSGSVQLHQATNSNVLNWGGGSNTTDGGCLYLIEEVEYEPLLAGQHVIDMSNGNFTASNADGNWHSRWSSTEFDGLTFGTTANNMQTAPENGNLLACATGSGCTYTLTVPEGCTITGYSFSFKNSSNTTNTKTITANGQQYTSSSSTLQTVTVTGLSANSVEAFSMSGHNSLITLSDFIVTIEGEPLPYAVPFEATTITDGEFAADTKWYTMKINGHYISDNGEASYINLAGTTFCYNEETDFWCFVGNDEDGYQIYNKAKGTGYVLASSTTMTGENGGTTYPTLKAVNALPSGYSDRWNFSESTHGENGHYVALHGHDSYTINNRGDKLAFWTTGKDAGSTVVFEVVERGCTVDLEHGSFEGTGTYHSTWNSSEMEGLTFGTGRDNNMKADNVDATLISCFTGSGCTYTLSAPDGYVIKSYSFDYKLRSDNTGYNVTVDGTAATTTPATLADNDYNERTFSFVQGGANKGITLSNFTVVIGKQQIPRLPKVTVFQTAGQSIPYRIPAIAHAKNGNLIAVADYRYSKNDIGMSTNGKLDLRYSVSTDKGKTWGDVRTLVAGRGEEVVTDPNNTNVLDVAFGDPCIVADRESDEVLVMSCAGNVSFPNGTRDKHQYIVTMRSNNNGETWGSPVDVAEQFYSQLDRSKIGTPKSMFVGSGKISQSKTIKVGSHYRIYCAVLMKDVNDTNKNYAFYSDDFGHNWTVLGSVDVSPIPSGADEPKADELPDGSVLVSSRVNGGRYFNIFRYTDVAKGEGNWSTCTFSGSGNGGTASPGYTCNGEILTIPVKRNSDNKDMYLQLQSVPFGDGRQNLGIYYKELETLEDFNSGANIAKNWDDRFQVSYITSCYSTMVLLDDNTLAFLYEENSTNSGYDINYMNLTIDQITGDAYTVNPDVDATAFVKAGMPAELAAMEAKKDDKVGHLLNAGYMAIEEAYNAYMDTPSQERYVAFNKAVSEAAYRKLYEGVEYRVNNKAYPTKYLTLQASGLTAVALDESSAAQKLTFSAGTVEGSWLVKGNGAWIENTGTNNADGVAVATTAEAASDYLVVSNSEGLTYFRCLTPDNATYPGIHVNSDGNVVRWNTSADASLWYVTPLTESPEDLIDGIIVECNNELAHAGKVGYPVADNAATTAYQTAFDNAMKALKAGTATQDIYDELTTRRTAYQGVTDVELPESGKVYTITAVNTSGTKAYLYYKNATDGYRLAQGDEIPESAYFICRTFDDNGVTKHVFVNPEGKYFVWKGMNGGNSNKGYNDTYHATYSPVWFKRLANKFGALYMVGKRSAGTATLVLNNALGENAFNANSNDNPAFSSSYTSALLIEEVADYKYNSPKLQTKDGKAYATLFLPYATTIPTDVEAYYAAEPVDGTVNMTKIEDETLPKNTPVVLMSETDGEKPFVPAIEAGTTVTENTLYGTMAADEEVGTGHRVYALTGKYANIGFHIFSGATYSPGKAYLRVSESTAQGFVMNFGGETTGIGGIMNGAVSGKTVYDLSGRRVENPGKGLYIIGGKKVYIK